MAHQPDQGPGVSCANHTLGFPCPAFSLSLWGQVTKRGLRPWRVHEGCWASCREALEKPRPQILPYSGHWRAPHSLSGRWNCFQELAINFSHFSGRITPQSKLTSHCKSPAVTSEPRVPRPLAMCPSCESELAVQLGTCI